MANKGLNAIVSMVRDAPCTLLGFQISTMTLKALFAVLMIANGSWLADDFLKMMHILIRLFLKSVFVLVIFICF